MVRVAEVLAFYVVDRDGSFQTYPGPRKGSVPTVVLYALQFAPRLPGSTPGCPRLGAELVLLAQSQSPPGGRR